MKYVLNQNTTMYCIIPDYMNHCDVYGTWTNAGKIIFKSEKDSIGNDITIVECFGSSISLDLKSDGENDSRIINNSLNLML